MANLIRLGSLGLAVLLLLSCSAMSDFKEHQGFVKDTLLNNESFPTQTLVVDGFPLRYVEAGKARDGIIVWVHGTPGGWTEAGKLFADKQLLSRAKLVSLDRPGWGASVTPNSKRKHHVSFEEQNRYISPLLRKLKTAHPNTPLYIAGHSWGASLAPYLAVNNAELVSGLVLFAGTFNQKYAKPRWYHHIGETWPVRSLIGAGMLKANSEMFSLPKGLAEMSGRWPELSNIPILVVQGGKDYLVKAKNVGYIEDAIASDHVHTVVDQAYGHMWHIQRNAQVSACLMAMVSAEPHLCDRAVLGEADSAKINKP